MSAAKKITVHVPAELLARARRTTGRGITETVRQGLQLVAAGEACAGLRRLRGEIALDLDLDRLREDR